MNLFEMKQNHAAALAKAEALVTAAESAQRPLTETEQADFTAALTEAKTLAPQIQQRDELNTLRAAAQGGRILPGLGTSPGAKNGGAGTFSAESRAAFDTWVASRGTVAPEGLAELADAGGGFKFPATPRRTRASAALYEGNVAVGGAAVPYQVSGEFVPLAPPEMGAYSLVDVVPTTMDTRYVRKLTTGQAAAKLESGAANNPFTGTDPAIEPFTLSAFMMGHPEDASWELLQDAPQFQGFIESDILLSLAALREAWLIQGSGVGMAQGMLGNVGTGVTGETADAAGNLLSIKATLDVQGALNAVYHPNASYLMHRSSSIELRNAQLSTNLFNPIFTRSGGKDYLHDYPVAYSSSMPLIAAGSTPVLFGDFRAGYIFGERGGSGVNVKILDQPKAIYGLLTVLGYQRVDGRVRRSEAVQPITLHS